MAPDKSFPNPCPKETLGQRIGRLRSLLGWTQQELADRVAISRVAVSHLEMGVSVPSERTVALLAGVFHLDPLDMIEGTAYPDAKVERLPLVTARYTEVELQLALMQRDLGWLGQLEGQPNADAVCKRVHREWDVRLSHLASSEPDPGERKLLAEARTTLRANTAPFRHTARNVRSV